MKLLAGAVLGDPTQALMARTRSDDDGRGPASLKGATGWLNSPPLTMAGLRGKVVLVEFWTYSCINWRREYPYVRAWAQKYKDSGLVVIGVHSPEFGFEKDVENVKRAVRDIGVDHPVAIDSDHAIWRSFGNAYWPALYFMDARGRVRHRHFGEGDYAQSETVIQRLLTEATGIRIGPKLVDVVGSGAEAPPDWENLRSPETYGGYGRATGLASDGAMRNKRRVYDAPTRLRINQWALAGEWTWQEEAAVSNAQNGRIAYCFHARDLHMVMGPAARGSPVPFRVTCDGAPPAASHGVDVDQEGRGTASEHRMYQLIRQRAPIADRRFEIEFLVPGIEVFSFTFG